MANPKMVSPPEADAPQGPLYPVIESLVEWVTRDEVGTLFSPIKQELGALKGPRAEQAKKVKAAIERTEELLLHLIDVREALAQEKKDKPRK
jgi:hypothetical protein